MSLLLLLALSLAPQDPAPVMDEEAEIRRCEELLRQSPADRTAAWQLGYMLYSRGEMERARSIFEESLRLHGERGYAMYMLGAIAERQFRYDDALALYQQSRAVEEGYEPAIEGAARAGGILSNLKRFRKARDRISRELLLVLVGAGFAVLLATFLTGHPNVHTR
ncbi:MAG: tetratricopeptide repeat protein [Planctomycetota bacterium]